jgi:hypothetical protein
MDTPLATHPPIAFQPRPPFRRRKPRPAPPVLVAAELVFDPVTGDPCARLAFDRAIDVSRIAPAQVTVDDAAGAGWSYAGSGVASRPDAKTVVIALVQTGGAEGPTVLHATAATGIVAAEDGGAWAGVASVELPYP